MMKLMRRMRVQDLTSSSENNGRATAVQDAGQTEREKPQSSIESGENILPTYLAVDPHDMEEGLHEQQPYHLDPSERQLQGEAAGATPQSTGGLQHNAMHGNHSNRSGLDQLTLLAQAFEPYTVPGPPGHNPTSVPSARTPERLYSAPSGASGTSNAAPRSSDEDERNGSYGTLMVSKGGRSKYLGPTAGSEWLKESETRDASESPLITRAPTPELPQDSGPSLNNQSSSLPAPIGFPFNASAANISTRDLLSCLPPREEAWTLAEAYYRYCAWHHDVAPKALFEKTFDRVYTLAEGGSLSTPGNPQEIALVFIIMAQGTLFNIEMSNYDSSAEDWLHLSERALVKGDFLSNNMVAGLQTLHLMAHLHLQLDKGRRGDNAWPLWGLVMRLIQAMGMHRDGARWNLPHDVAEERRKVFWECNAADVFQAHCFSRPSAINPEHCDTAFPSEPLNPRGEKTYSILRFELSQLSSEILNMTMKVRKPAYSDVTNLDLRLGEFERNLPFSLRCRAALLAMPSRYPRFEAAIEASPEPSRRSMTISFQQTNLALNISETIINLHRPYYAKALYDDVESVESVYAPSFLTVVERCAILIGIVSDIHTRFPAVSVRQWNFWYHVFGSALCLGTMVLRDPGNVMATFALEQIDTAISLFTSLIQYGASTPRYKRNLQWLLKLRARALSKISVAGNGKKADPQRDPDTDRSSNAGDREHGEDVELLGWRTRLIERAGQDRPKIIRTIHLAATPTDSQTTENANPPPSQNQFDGPQVQLRPNDMMMPSTSFPMATPDSTDDILCQFWDPMLLQNVFESPYDQPNPFIDSAWWDATAIVPGDNQAQL
ncbi:hypothetical protein ABEF95_014691 [Exophiala dermatitidis]